ncbi:MAG: DeoR/GlpR family DNA-binding transcription regulator [Oscillospiraceae bacterium]
MNNKQSRLNNIIDILRINNGASVKNLSENLCVSEMTIRRDLESLNNDNLIKLVHGAAIFNPEPEDEKYLLSKEDKFMEKEKDRIGRAAASMIEPGDTVIIDVGTTAQRLANHIVQFSPITVICFTVNTLNRIVKKNVQRLLLGGGYFHSNTQMFESNESLEMIKNVRATKLFLTASGVSDELGITCSNMYEVATKRECISSALTKILIVDSSKFGKINPGYFADLDVIDVLITDSGITKQWIDIIKNHAIDLRVV